MTRGLRRRRQEETEWEERGAEGTSSDPFLTRKMNSILPVILTCSTVELTRGCSCAIAASTDSSRMTGGFDRVSDGPFPSGWGRAGETGFPFFLRAFLPFG